MRSFPKLFLSAESHRLVNLIYIHPVQCKMQGCSMAVPLEGSSKGCSMQKNCLI